MSTRKHSDSKKRNKKKIDDSLTLICGHIPTLPDSVGTRCAKCSQRCWGTRGSVERAKSEGIPILCIDCFEKLEDPHIAGVMHHGRMLSQAEAQAFADGVFAAMARHGRN